MKLWLDKEFCIVSTPFDLFKAYLKHKGCEEYLFYYHMEKAPHLCTNCNKKVPDKIWMMYKLWMFHNG